jgi:hypothetical protein
LHQHFDHDVWSQLLATHARDRLDGRTKTPTVDVGYHFVTNERRYKVYYLIFIKSNCFHNFAVEFYKTTSTRARVYHKAIGADERSLLSAYVEGGVDYVGQHCEHDTF